MRNIINLVNVKISTETYGSFASNLDTDTYFILYEYPLEIFQLIRVNGCILEIVGVSLSDTSDKYEYKIKLSYDVY